MPDEYIRHRWAESGEGFQDEGVRERRCSCESNECPAFDERGDILGDGAADAADEGEEKFEDEELVVVEEVGEATYKCLPDCEGGGVQ